MTKIALDRRKLIKGGAAAASSLALAKTSPSLASPASSSRSSLRRNQDGAITLQFAHMNSWNAEWDADLDRMVQAWNEANSDVQVEVIKWTWDTYFATMTAAIGANEAPDIMNIGWGEVVLIGRQHLLDLAPLVSAETLASYNESSFRSSTFGDEIYGLPAFEQMNQVLYYRADFAEEAGVSFDDVEFLTWEGLVDAAQRMSADGRSGLGVNARGRGIAEPFAAYQYQNGSNMVEQQEGQWVSVFDSDGAREAGQFFVDLWRDHEVVNPNNLEKGYTELVNDLGLGTTAMFHGVTQNYFALVEQYPDLAEQFKIAPPQQNAAPSTIGGAFTMSVFKDTDAPEEAVRFIEWATSADTLANYWLPKGQILSTNPDVPSPGMPEDIAERMQQYQDVQNVFPFSTQWETVRERVLSPRLAQLVTGQQDFDSGWDEIHEEAQKTVQDAD